MLISIEIAKEEHMNKCYQLLSDSELGRTYFAHKDPFRIISNAIRREEIYVALGEEGHCLGFIWCEMNGTFGKYQYLHMIIVDENLRCMGIGKKLIGHFENSITAGYDKVFLMVGDFNVRAKQLYESLGYKEIGVLENFYTNGVNEYLMVKNKEVALKDMSR